MAIPVLIMGRSGSGKTYSLKNFEPDEIGIISVEKGRLPFKSKLKVAIINAIDRKVALDDLAISKGVEFDDNVFKQTEAIIGSMTPEERERPEIINARRRERIAKGSGTTMADVNRLLKQFEDMRKMMKMAAGGKMRMPQMPRGFRR